MNITKDLEIFNNKFITCESENCPFRRECANHVTAGEFRYEDGFRPHLRKEGDEFFCDSFDEEPIDSEFHMFPVPKNTSDCGAATMKDILRNSCDDYVI